MGRTYLTSTSIVSKKRESLFQQRCRDALAAKDMVETEVEHPLLGTLPLDEKSSLSTYMAKLRAFVTFLLDWGDTSDFDDCLLLFCSRAPRGVITCSEKAVHCFLLSVFGKKDTPLKDLEVSCREIAKS